MTDTLKNATKSEGLYLEEFMQMCADSGYVSENTARDICRFAKFQGGIESIPPFPNNFPEDENRFTDLLASIPPGNRSFNNYIVTEENSYAVELARTVALIPRIWKSISPILFHAGTGQGKTHLLSAIATSSRQNILFLNLNDLKMGYNYCIKTNKESQLLKWIISHNLLLLDDLQFVQNDLNFQHFLCSVINQMPHGKSAIVLCSNSEVENLQDLDSTFFSRISSGISIELKPIDLPGRISILNQLFKSAGFGPDDEIISFIAINITQNIRTLKAAGRAVLAYLFASPSSQNITIEKVSEILESMNLRQFEHPKNKKESNVLKQKIIKKQPSSNKKASSDNKNILQNKDVDIKIEANTSATNTEKKDVISPYIVVDIDNEEKLLKENITNEEKKYLEKTNKEKIKEEEVTDKIKNTSEIKSTDDEEIFKEALKANKLETTIEPPLKNGSNDKSRLKTRDDIEEIEDFEDESEIVDKFVTKNSIKDKTQDSSVRKNKGTLEQSDSTNHTQTKTETTIETETKAETAKETKTIPKKTLTKEQHKENIENATSINAQIISLKKAAQKRIDQLAKKNPDNPEISKLRLAIIFLEQGKIESAMLALK